MPVPQNKKNVATIVERVHSGLKRTNETKEPTKAQLGESESRSWMDMRCNREDPVSISGDVP